MRQSTVLNIRYNICVYRKVALLVHVLIDELKLLELVEHTVMLRLVQQCSVFTDL